MKRNWTRAERGFLKKTLGKGERKSLSCFYIEFWPNTDISTTSVVLKKIRDHWDWWYRDLEGRL